MNGDLPGLLCLRALERLRPGIVGRSDQDPAEGYLRPVVGPPGQRSSLSTPHARQELERVEHATVQGERLVGDERLHLLAGEPGAGAPRRILVDFLRQLPALEDARVGLEDLVHDGIVKHVAQGCVDVANGTRRQHASEPRLPSTQRRHQVSHVPRTELRHGELPQQGEHVETEAGLLVPIGRDPAGLPLPEPSFDQLADRHVPPCPGARTPRRGERRRRGPAPRACVGRAGGTRREARR